MAKWELRQQRNDWQKCQQVCRSKQKTTVMIKHAWQALVPLPHELHQEVIAGFNEVNRFVHRKYAFAQWTDKVKKIAQKYKKDAVKWSSRKAKLICLCEVQKHSYTVEITRYAEPWDSVMCLRHKLSRSINMLEHQGRNRLLQACYRPNYPQISAGALTS